MTSPARTLKKRVAAGEAVGRRVGVDDFADRSRWVHG